MDNKKFNKSTVIIAVCALGLSIASFIISYNSCNISKDDLDLKIEPKIKAKLIIVDSSNVKLVIHNEGTRSIKSLRLTTIKRYVLRSTQNNFETKRLSETKIVEKLDDEDSIEFKINYDDMKYVLDTAKIYDIKHQDFCEAYIGFYIAYKSKPDNTDYFFSKYILIWRTENGSFIPADLDGPDYLRYHNQNYKSEFEKTDYYYTN